MRKKKFLQLGDTGKRILKELADTNADPVEVYFLECLARTLELASVADKEIQEKGIVQTFETGARNVTPEWSVFRSAVNDAVKLAKELPKIRAALNVESEGEEITRDNIYSIAGLG